MWVNAPLALLTGLAAAIAGAWLGIQYGKDWMKAHGLDPDDPRKQLQGDGPAESKRRS